MQKSECQLTCFPQKTKITVYGLEQVQYMMTITFLGDLSLWTSVHLNSLSRPILLLNLRQREKICLRGSWLIFRNVTKSINPGFSYCWKTDVSSSKEMWKPMHQLTFLCPCRCECRGTLAIWIPLTRLLKYQKSSFD